MINNKLEKWNDWFAGMTDGDGCFYINKKEQSISFEVTTHTMDRRILYDIKNKLNAGSVRLRSNSQSVRYRVKAKNVIHDILNRLNGKLYNKARLEQFNKACDIMGIKQRLSSPLLDKKSAYLAGLIDSDGNICISVSKSTEEDSIVSGNDGKILRLKKSRGYNQMSLKVTSLDKDNIQLLKESYGFGTIYDEPLSIKASSTKIKYHWTITSQEEFSYLYELLKNYPLKGVKMHRIRLASLYFKYKDLNFHLATPGTPEFKIWEKFCKSWYKYGI
jgi:hypothetical protein